MRPRLPAACIAVFLTVSVSMARAGGLTVPAPAKNLEAAVAPKEESIYDRIWGLTDLYHDEGNEILQDLSLTGRFQGQYHWAESDTESDNGWETRRARIGIEARVFRDFTVKIEMNNAPDQEPFLNSFSNFAVQWHPSEAFILTAGMQTPRFSYDYSTSSNVHPYIERSQLLNQFRSYIAPAVSLQGKRGKILYYTALLSNSPVGDLGEDFSSFDGGATFIAMIGYDVTDIFHTSAADARLEYLHSEHNAQSTIYNCFDNGVAASLALRQGRVSLATEVLSGIGGDQGDAVGLNLMPGWYVTQKLELVARYQIAASNNDTGLNPQKRYERPVDLPPGDLYQAGYAGFNYYIYGPRLRLMGGVEFADMNGHDAWTALLGVRLFWGPDAQSTLPVGYPFVKR